MAAEGRRLLHHQQHQQQAALLRGGEHGEAAPDEAVSAAAGAEGRRLSEAAAVPARPPPAGSRHLEGSGGVGDNPDPTARQGGGVGIAGGCDGHHLIAPDCRTGARA